jgi:predicted nucleic acid-binding protein
MPEAPQQLVVVNATPIIALALIGKLDLLRQLYGQVVAPRAVEAEVVAGGGGGIGSAALRGATWLRVSSLQDPRRADLLPDLDRGEAEVIALAQELNADLVIIDERLARRHAKRLGLPLTGTLGVLLKAKQLGLVDAVAPLIEELRLGGIRLSDAVAAEVLDLADEN